MVRHGETAWNVEHRSQGDSDIPLSAQGFAQAAALARALAGAPVQAVYSSPLRRARDTAAAIAAHHGLPVLVEPDFRELRQGDLEGLTSAEMRARYADLLAQWREDPTCVRLPGGENVAELAARVAAAFDRLRTRHAVATGKVVLVAHNFTNRVLLCALLGVSLSRMRAIPQDVAALTALELCGPTVRLLILNSTLHLEGVGDVPAGRER